MPPSEAPHIVTFDIQISTISRFAPDSQHADEALRGAVALIVQRISGDFILADVAYNVR
jgi:hypothetical protein